MKLKKILMFILLIAFIIGIGLIMSKVINKSAEEGAKLTSNENKNIIEITDKYFIAITDDIYINLEDYVGKTIKMEGLIYKYDDGEGNDYYAVVRNTPGCCGNDGLAGLDIQYDGEYPEENTWVEIVGTVEKAEWENGYTPLVRLTSMAETEPGQDFVTN